MCRASVACMRLSNGGKTEFSSTGIFYTPKFRVYTVVQNIGRGGAVVCMYRQVTLMTLSGLLM